MDRKNATFLLLYVLLICYGSLYPFTGWRVPTGDPLALFLSPLKEHLSRPDLVTNLLAYLPLGYLAMMLLTGEGREGKEGIALFAAGFLGCLLSASMEFLQLFLPSRVSSVIDLALNGFGSCLGACLARWRQGKTGALQGLHRWRDLWFMPGWRGNGGLAVAGLWALSQLAPFVPSLDVGSVRAGLRPLWHTLRDPGSFRLAETAVYCCSIAAAAGAVLLAAKRRWPVLGRYTLFVAAVLFLKIFMTSRQLSLEAVTGSAAALAALPLLAVLPRSALSAVAGAAALAAFTCDELRATTGHFIGLRSFNWIPFLSQMMRPLTGFISILEGVWPFFTLAYLAQAAEFRTPRYAALWGAGAVTVLTFALEWCQLGIPGRYPDVTQVALSLAGWSAAYLAAGRETLRG